VLWGLPTGAAAKQILNWLFNVGMGEELETYNLDQYADFISDKQQQLEITFRNVEHANLALECFDLFPTLDPMGLEASLNIDSDSVWNG